MFVAAPPQRRPAHFTPPNQDRATFVLLYFRHLSTIILISRGFSLSHPLLLLYIYIIYIMSVHCVRYYVVSVRYYVLLFGAIRGCGVG